MLSRRICKICDQKIYIVSSKVLYCCFKAPEDNVWYRLMVMLKLLKDLIVVKCICWPWQAFPCLLIRQHVTFYLSSLWRATVKNTKYIYKYPQSYVMLPYFLTIHYLTWTWDKFGHTKLMWPVMLMVESMHRFCWDRAKFGHGLLSGDYSQPIPEGAEDKAQVSCLRSIPVLARSFV